MRALGGQTPVHVPQPSTLCLDMQDRESPVTERMHRLHNCAAALYGRGPSVSMSDRPSAAARFRALSTPMPDDDCASSSPCCLALQMTETDVLYLRSLKSLPRTPLVEEHSLPDRRVVTGDAPGTLVISTSRTASALWVVSSAV